MLYGFSSLEVRNVAYFHILHYLAILQSILQISLLLMNLGSGSFLVLDISYSEKINWEASCQV
jgi:hypothetical protein